MPKQVAGLWLPDHETHLIPYLERGPQFAGGATYQFQKFALAFPFIETFRHAVDVGAHCGLWSRVLSHCFPQVTAFEPLPINRECFVMNVTSEGVRLHDCALGNHDGAATMDVPSECSGWSFVDSRGSTQVPIRTLDSFEFTILDFLKLDCEGYEYFVVEGGAQTIRKLKPTIIVEQKIGAAERYKLRHDDAVTLLKSWGAEVRFELDGDFVMSW
ncbi:MAG: FkbM family methyltransferase [Xanthobacteraceae bacterium]|nr:FkbM family methyltransferase [Xanthobacteraceae bacterium]MBX9829410.1 FkbM family methyltransferase [Xanthobacteraceae bacterium]